MMFGRALLSLTMLAGVAHADIVVQARSGEPVVQVSGRRVAVFQPRDNEVWIIAGPGRKAVTLPGVTDEGRVSAAWRVEQLQVSGGQGVRVVGAAPRLWGVSGKPGAWVARPGMASKLPEAQGLSVVMLRDRVLAGVAGEAVPALVAVAPDGVRYRVVPAEGRVAGATSSVLAGLVDDVGEMMLAEGDLDKIAPASGPVMPKATDKAARLAKVEAPVPETEELAPLRMQTYVPGTLVPFVLPEDWGWRGEEPVPVSKLERGMQSAVADGAVAEAAAAVEAVKESSAEAEVPVVEAPVAVKPAHADAHKAAPSPVVADTVETLKVPDLAGLMAWPDVAVRDFVKKRDAAERELQMALAGCTGLNKPVAEAPAAHADGHEADGHADGAEPGHAMNALDEGGEAAEGAHGGGKKDAGLTPDSPGKAAVGWSMQDYLACANAPAVRMARMNLARVLLVAARPGDALNQLALLPQKNGMPTDAEGRFLQLVGRVMTRDFAGAEKLVASTEFPAAWAPQVAVWRSVAREGLGRSAAAVDGWPVDEEGSLLADYPAGMRLILQRALAEAQVAVADPKDAQAFVDALAEGYAESGPTGVAPAWLDRLRGKVRMGGENEKEGLELLARAANQTQDPETGALAKYDFVQALLRRGEISRPQALAYLDELRLYWRGDALEKQVLNQMGDLYLAEKDYRRALDSWQTLVRLDPDAPEMESTTTKMSNALLTAFDPEEGVPYSALAFTGLYFDFKELLPPDVRGDRVTERTADLMGEMGLHGRSIPLYSQLLQDTQLAPIDQARLALKLAGTYRNVRNAAQAIRTLDQYAAAARSNSVLAGQWPLMEARALMDLRRYDSALKALGKARGADADGIRAEIAWRTQDWTTLEAMLGPKIRQLADGVDAQGAVPVEVLRLAFAEGVRDDTDGLMKLASTFAPVMAKDPVGADMMAAMASEAGISSTLPGAAAGGGGLGQVAATLRDMNQVASAAQAAREEVIEEEAVQEDYNAKMRYMELLPPPAI